MKIFVFAFFAALLSVSTSVYGATVSGTIIDAQTGAPVAYASVQVLGTGRSMIANETGQYNLRLNNGRYNLKFSCIGYLSDEQEINLTDSLALDISLVPTAIVIKGIKAYDRALDPGQRIIVEAIKRKKDILSKIKTYSFDAYARLSISKPDKKAEDSIGIFLIAETQTSGFWESPDKYKEIINSRRQTSNIEPENNLISIGEILNFNLNRIEFGQYLVASPTAEDALDYYNYYLMDTIYIDNKPVFHLEFEPRSQSVPLLAGFIDIADSTYDVVGVSVTPNEALKFPMILELQYSQRFAEFPGDIWMPIEERINGRIDIPFPGIPILTIDYLASIYDYRFNMGHPLGTFDEYILEVDEKADDIDSIAWLALPTIPLTPKEVRAYTTIDSIQKAPKPFYYYPAYGVGTVLALSMGAYDFVHYNRVEGAFAGLGIETDKLLPGLTLHAKPGYAFELERWRHNYGFEYELSRNKHVRVGFEYHDEIAHRPTIFTPSHHNPTFLAFMFGADAFDYYLEKGFRAHAKIRPIRHLDLQVSFENYKQYTVGANTDYSLFGEDTARFNPPIVDGHLRAIGGTLTWDSRPLINNKGEEFPESRLPYIIFQTGVEYSSPDLFDSDFSYRRHYVSLNPHYRFLGLGISELHLYGGIADGFLPPQNLFAVDFAGELMPEDISFKTLGRNNFSGNQVFSAYYDHDFGRLLFLKLGLPGLKDSPLAFGIHGGFFWTDLNGDNYTISRTYSRLARTAFSELGFSLGRIPPLSGKLYFTWQLSGYAGDDIDKVSIDFNIEF